MLVNMYAYKEVLSVSTRKGNDICEFARGNLYSNSDPSSCHYPLVICDIAIENCTYT